MQNTADNSTVLQSRAPSHIHAQIPQQGHLLPYNVLIPPIETLKDFGGRAGKHPSSAYPIDPRLLRPQGSFLEPGHEDRAEGSSRGQRPTAPLYSLSSSGIRLSAERQTQTMPEDQKHSNQDSGSDCSPEDDEDDNDNDEDF